MHHFYNKSINFFSFLLVISTVIFLLYIILPIKLLNYPLVEFLRVLSHLFNLQIIFDETFNTFYVYTPELVVQLTNESSGFIFNSFIIIFGIFSPIKWRNCLVSIIIFIPLNFFLNAFRMLLIFVLSSDIHLFYFCHTFFSIFYYIFIFTLFFHYILFKYPQNPINLFNFSVLHKKKENRNLIKTVVNKSNLLELFILSYIIVSSSTIIGITYAILYRNRTIQPYPIDIDRYFKPIRMIRINETLYFVWDSENNIKTSIYSLYDSNITSKIFMQKRSPSQYYIDPFIQYDSISKNFIITGICQYSGYIGDTWMRIKDELIINQTELLDSNLNNGVYFHLSNEETELFNKIPPPSSNFINEYYFLLDENQNPIFFIKRGFDAIKILFSYNLTNSRTLFSGESRNYRVCEDNLNNTYFFFKSENRYFYSNIKNSNFSIPQRLSNLIEISTEADQLNVFCDSSNALYFIWLENQTQVFITSNKTGSFSIPQLLYNSSINISNPVIEYLDNSTGYMTFCDEDYKIYFFELNGTKIIHNRIFQDESLYPKPLVFPDLEIFPDFTVALFWRRILKMDYSIAQSKNDIGFIQYLGNGKFSDLIYIS